MTLRKGRLYKPCTKCGEMYPPTTKCAGLCPKCKPPSFLDLIAKEQAHTIYSGKPKRKKQ